MTFIVFALGVIVGLLIRDIKVKSVETFENIKKNLESKKETQFLEPVNYKDKLSNAKTLDDLFK